MRVGQRRHVLGVTGALKIEAYRPRGAHLDWPMQAGLFAFRSHERSVQEWFERTADQRFPSLAVVEYKRQERGSFGPDIGSEDVSNILEKQLQRIVLAIAQTLDENPRILHVYL